MTMIMMWTSDTSRTWEGIRMTALATEKLGCYELQQHKPCFDEKCSELLDERKQAKLQWFQNQSQTSGDNLTNVRRKSSRNSRSKSGNI